VDTVTVLPTEDVFGSVSVQNIGREVDLSEDHESLSHESRRHFRREEDEF
jgi:hypothetical protein